MKISLLVLLVGLINAAVCAQDSTIKIQKVNDWGVIVNPAIIGARTWGAGAGIFKSVSSNKIIHISSHFNPCVEFNRKNYYSKGNVV